MNPIIFESYLKLIWPIQRKFIFSLKPRCLKCQISQAYSTLDKKDLCIECADHIDIKAKSFSHSKSQADSELSASHHAIQDWIQKIIQPANPYDAIILLSGGKDSAVSLSLMKTHFPTLRMLGVFVDNGFSSPAAIENIKYLVDRFKIDYLNINSHITQFSALFRDAFLSLKGRPAYKYVDGVDGRYIFDLARQVAKSFGIQTVISGLSITQLEKIRGIKNSWHDDSRGVLEVFPLAVWPLEEVEIKNYLVSKRLIDQKKMSPIQTNNQLILPMCVVDILNLGYCSFEPEFAQMIREGRADPFIWRNTFELLEYGTKSGMLIKKANQILSKLGLTVNDIIQKGS